MRLTKTALLFGSSEKEPSFEPIWQSRRPRVRLIAVGLVLVLVLSAQVSCGGETGGGDDGGGTPEAESEDTGRMSNGEYGLFQTMNDEVLTTVSGSARELRGFARSAGVDDVLCI